MIIPNYFFFFTILGMWSCSFYLGNFISPTVSGIAIDKYGFRATTIAYFAMCTGILFVDFIELYFSVKAVKQDRNKGYEQLE